MKRFSPADSKRFKQAVLASALLVFGSTGVANAQMPADVTLYGLLDIGVGFVKGNNRKKTGLMEGSTYGPGSRWGLRMTEDLGGGIKVGAVMESGFSISRGVLAQGGRLFGRQVYLSLSSEQYGELRMGRQYAFNDSLLALMNATGNTTVVSPSHPYGYTDGGGNDRLIFLAIDSARVDNALQMISPRMYGLQAQVMYGFAGDANEDLYRGVKLDYLNGPVNLSAIIERSSVRNPAVQVGGKSAANKLFALGGNYDFTLFKLFAGYEQVKDMAAATAGAGGRIGAFHLALPGFTIREMRAISTGVSVPIGAVTYAANFARTRYKNGIGQGRNLSRYGVAATYNLSKRTAVYTAFAFTGGDLKSVVHERRFGQLGLRHRF